MALENIPPVEDRFYGVEDAMLVVGEAFKAMEPDGALCEQWDAFYGTAVRWADREEQVPIQALINLRTSLEKICGDEKTGEDLIAAAKMGLCVAFLATTNIFHIVIPDRHHRHDFLGPLCEKGVVLLHLARETEPYDPTVRLDYAITETLEQRTSAVQEEMAQDWLGDMISRAVRPEAQDG